MGAVITPVCDREPPQSRALSERRWQSYVIHACWQYAKTNFNTKCYFGLQSVLQCLLHPVVPSCCFAWSPRDPVVPPPPSLSPHFRPPGAAFIFRPRSLACLLPPSTQASWPAGEGLIQGFQQVRHFLAHSNPAETGPAVGASLFVSSGCSSGKKRILLPWFTLFLMTFVCIHPSFLWVLIFVQFFSFGFGRILASSEILVILFCGKHPYTERRNEAAAIKFFY